MKYIVRTVEGNMVSETNNPSEIMWKTTNEVIVFSNLIQGFCTFIMKSFRIGMEVVDDEYKFVLEITVDEK